MEEINGRYKRMDNKKIHKFYLSPSVIRKRRHSSVGIALDYRMDDRSSRVRFPAGAGNFSLHHRVQKGPGAHQVS
jgi:hypothetical protein